MSSRTQATNVQGTQGDALTHYLRLFTRFLQVCFGTWHKGDYIWRPDDKTTDIVIQGEGTVNKEVVEKRPAIIVARGPMQWGNLAMDQFAGPLMTRDPHTGQRIFTPNHNTYDGAKRYTDLNSSTMTYTVLSREGLEAQRIAGFCAYATRVLKKTLMKAGLHKVGDDIQVGSESSPGSIVQPDSTEIIAVAVHIPFYFQVTYTITPADKLLLKEVDMALSSDTGYPAPGAVPIKEPGINGRVIGYSNTLVLSQTASAGPFVPPKPLRS
jgi:hypothetical protein